MFLLNNPALPLDRLQLLDNKRRLPIIPHALGARLPNPLPINQLKILDSFKQLRLASVQLPLNNPIRPDMLDFITAIPDPLASPEQLRAQPEITADSLHFGPGDLQIRVRAASAQPRPRTLLRLLQ